MVEESGVPFLVVPIDKPLAFASAGRFTADAGWTHAQRVIDSYEVIVGLEGVLYIQQEDKLHEIRRGDVLLLLPYHTHKGYRPCTAGTSFYWIHFTSGSAVRLLQGDAICNGKTAHTTGEPIDLSASIAIPLCFTPDDTTRINIFCRQLLHLSQFQSYTRLGADYLLTLLLIELTQQAFSVSGQQRPLRNIDKIVAEIAELVRINTYEEVSISGLVEKYGITYDYAARRFKQIMGVHIKEYIASIRMEKAKALLMQTGKSIKELAWLLGFRDEKYFMKQFKKTQGMTPSQYRSAFYRTHLNKK